MNRTYILVVGVVALLAIGGVSYGAYTLTRPLPSVVTPVIPDEPPQETEALPYGEVTLALGESAIFKDVSITPLVLVEDSRCPVNANCIWAGRARVQVQTVSGMGTSTDVLILNDGSLTTEAEEISLIGVEPTAIASRTISKEDYRFTFSVTKRSMEVGKCYIGGCSSQICSDQPDVASTCEYREQYGCYRTATCTRQPTGECGWTMDEALKTCLAATS